MKKILTNSKGFTLIELMVVVAIIGVLSAIAVPNFKKYQAKAKQSEAKIQLAAIYTVEVGSMADNDAYATCLTILGYDTSPRGYYILGFTASEVAAAAARNALCVAATAIPPSIQLKAGAAAVAAVGDMDATTVLTTGVTFLAGAAGNISSTLFDKWTITDTKALTNTTVGY